MTDFDTIEKHRQDLETVANADCSASWIAEELLSSVEGETSLESKETEQTGIQTNSEPNTDTSEPDGSVFDY